MGIAARRLEVAFKLAESDLGVLDVQEQAQLRRDVMAFLLAAPQGPGSDTGGVWFGSNLSQPSDREVRELQVVVRHVVDGLLEPVHPIPIEHTVRNLSLVPVRASGGTVVVRAEGAFRDRFVMALLLLLAHVGTSKVKRCQVCGRPFLKFGRRLYCERPDCVERQHGHRWAAYARRHPDKVRAARKKQYAKHGWKLGARSKSSQRGKARKHSTKGAAS